MQLWSHRFLGALALRGRRILSDLKLVQLLAPVLVVGPELINFVLLSRHLSKQLRISVLAAQELVYNVLNVTVASFSPNFLESSFNFESAIHFFSHFGLKERRPELLSQEVLLHLQLIGIFVLVGCGLRDLLLASHTSQSAVNSILFVLSRILQGADALIALTMLLLNQVHEVFQPVLSLQPALFALPVLFSLLVHNIHLLLVSIV